MPVEVNRLFSLLTKCADGPQKRCLSMLAVIPPFSSGHVLWLRIPHKRAGTGPTFRLALGEF